MAGHPFPRGRLVLLDVYGANHDPEQWDTPERFVPERFAGETLGAFEFIPQGGGDHATGHRCAGERITIEEMKLGASFLAGMRYDVLDQDLGIPLRRIPTRPRSGFVMKIHRAGEPAT